MHTHDIRYIEAKKNVFADTLSRPSDVPLGEASILNRTRVISSPYMQRAASCSVGEKLKEKMGHKLMFGSHFSYEYGQL